MVRVAASAQEPALSLLALLLAPSELTTKATDQQQHGLGKFRGWPAQCRAASSLQWPSNDLRAGATQG
eukprot:9432716-Alexandrium_andersonii.AAC.1